DDEIDGHESKGAKAGGKARQHEVDMAQAHGLVLDRRMDENADTRSKDRQDLRCSHSTHVARGSPRAPSLVPAACHPPIKRTLKALLKMRCRDGRPAPAAEASG